MKDRFVDQILPPEVRRLLPWLSLAYYWLLAAVLLVAALAKSLWLAPDARTGLFQIPWLLAAVVALEVLAAGGLLFLAPQRPALVRRAAMTLFTILAAFALHAVVRGESCQCFGTEAIPPTATLLFDLMAVGLLAFLPLPPQAQRWTATTSAGFTVTGLLALSLGSWSFWTAPTTLPTTGSLPAGTQPVALQPASWVGQRLPILEYVDLDGDLGDGQWLLVLYRPDCAHCLRIVPQLRDQFLSSPAPTPSAGDVSTQRLALVDLSAGQAAGAIQGASGPQVVFGRMQPNRRWIATPPIGLILNGGVVTQVLNAAELESWRLDSNLPSE